LLVLLKRGGETNKTRFEQAKTFRLCLARHSPFLYLKGNITYSIYAILFIKLIVIIMVKARRYPIGLIGPDTIDNRDLLLAEHLDEQAEVAPSVMLIDRDTPIERQRFGSCTANAITGVAQFLNKEEYGRDIDLAQRYVYHKTKVISHLWNTEGDFIRNALKALVDYGAPLEEDWAEGTMKWEEYVQEVPPASVEKKALQYRARSYYRVDRTVDAIKRAIDQTRHPLATGMMWNKAFNKPEKDGRLPLPKTGENVGGHAVSIIGYDEDAIWFRNSWGKDWGHNGYFYILVKDWDKYALWDNWVVLDVILGKGLEGWVATDYLQPIDLAKESRLLVKANLNVRDQAGGKLVGQLKSGEEVEILEPPIVKEFLGRKYIWQKVKKVDSKAEELSSFPDDSTTSNPSLLNGTITIWQYSSF
jgi:hypothetical protein